MKMCNMKRHQLTNETKQTGFRAGFFSGLIGINCERLQSTAQRLTFASSERFLLIVLMITMGAGDHRQAGNGLPGLSSCQGPGQPMFAWVLGMPLSPATCCGKAAPSTRPQGLGHGVIPHGAWLLAHTETPVYKVDGETHRHNDPGHRPGGEGGRGRREEQWDWPGLALRLEALCFFILQ